MTTNQHIIGLDIGGANHAHMEEAVAKQSAIADFPRRERRGPAV